VKENRNNSIQYTNPIILLTFILAKPYESPTFAYTDPLNFYHKNFDIYFSVQGFTFKVPKKLQNGSIGLTHRIAGTIFLLCSFYTYPTDSCKHFSMLSRAKTLPITLLQFSSTLPSR